MKNKSIRNFGSDNDVDVAFVEQMGQFYESLCKIMDNINVAYSFQVFKAFVFNW